MDQFIKTIVLLMLGVSLSCTYQVELDFELPDPSAVLNASVSRDSLITVLVSKTTNGAINDTLKPANDKLYINDADVKLFINENDFGLMSKTNEPGRYMMPGYYPSSGDKVRIEVLTKDYQPVSSEVTVPKRPEIINVDTIMIPSNDNASPYLADLIDLKVRFKDKPDEKNYYLLTIAGIEVYKGEQEKTTEFPVQVTHDEELLFEYVRLNNYVGYSTHTSYIFSDAMINGKDYDLKMKLHNVYRSYYSDTLSVTNICHIRLSEISESLYLYYRSKLLQVKQQEDVFGSIGLREPIPTYTNVHNGYGLLSAKETTVYEIKIIPGDKPPAYWHGGSGYGFGEYEE